MGRNAFAFRLPYLVKLQVLTHGGMLACPIGGKSESRQSLRGVVRDRHAGNLLQRAIRFGGVPDQLRRVPVYLIEKFTIRGNPTVARAAADVSTKPTEGAVALDLGARRILRDSNLEAVDMEAADVAVSENRSVQESVIGRDG